MRQEPLPDPPPPGTCVVEALWSAISPGTERLVASGQVPTLLHDEMRCPHMDGDFSFPVKYGYSLVGEVRQGPAELVGRRVHVLHPHQSHCVVPVSDVFEVSEEIPSARATLASNVETAVTALWDAHVMVGDRALVVGFGIIGSLVARLLSQICGVSVVVAEVSPERLALARQMGFNAIEPQDLTTGFDVAFHASASSGGLQTCIDMVGFEGRVVELSWYGARPAEVRLGTSFHSQRKSIVSSQVSHISPHQRGRWDYRRRKHLVFNLLKDEAFDAHITEVVAFDQLPGWFEGHLANPGPGLAFAVRY